MWDILKPLRSRGDKQRPESPVRIKLAQVNFKVSGSGRCEQWAAVGPPSMQLG